MKRINLKVYTLLFASCITFKYSAIGQSQFRVEDLPKENQENIENHENIFNRTPLNHCNNPFALHHSSHSYS